MSQLPSGWASAQIRDLAASAFDGPFGSALKTSDYTTEGFRVARLENIGHLRFRGDLNSFVSEEKFRSLSRHVLKADDVLFSSFVDKQTRVCLVPRELNGRMINKADCFCIRLRDEAYEPRLLAYRLAAPASYAAFSDAVRGVTRPRIGLKDLSSYEIEVPPLAEQRRIVAKLDALTARTARARADLDRIPALAARYKQAVLAKAFSGELTAGWRASNRQAAMTSDEQDQARKLAWSGLSKRRGKYELAEVADWKPDLDLPENWRWASVDELTAMVQYGSSAKTSDEVAVPVLRMGNIVDGVLDLAKLKYLPKAHNEFPELLLDDGDLLFNRTNSAELVGKTAVFRGATGSTSFASYLIRLKSVGYHPELLAAYINSSFGRSWVATAISQQVGQANVNGTKLRRLGVPLMPADEQLVIWQRIKSAFAEIDRLTAEAAAARRLLDRLDQAVLAKAFRGELVPQDPADEPASVLLDRIRAERAAAPKAKRGRKAAA